MLNYFLLITLHCRKIVYRLIIPWQAIDDLVSTRGIVGVTRLGNDGADDALYTGCDVIIAEHDLVYRISHSRPLRVGTCE